MCVCLICLLIKFYIINIRAFSHENKAIKFIFIFIEGLVSIFVIHIGYRSALAISAHSVKIILVVFASKTLIIGRLIEI